MTDDMPQYVSSAPDYIQKEDTASSIDEQDISTLIEVLAISERAKQFFNSNESLTLDKDVITLFGVEAQLAINTKVTMHIETIRLKMESAINKVKEKNNGREF